MVKREFDEEGNEATLEEFDTYLSGVASTHPFEKVKQSASQMLALFASQSGEILDAYDKFESLAGLSLDSDAKISALFSKNIFESSDMQYDNEALATTTALYAEFSGDERTQLAGIFTEIITGADVPQNNAKRRNFSVAMRKFPGSISSGENLPKTFALYQNYPNPFNPETKFLFDVPVQANVEITLYDLLGRKVTTLVNEIKPAGRYSVNWNAANNASGVYFAKMFSEHFSQVRKIMLMK